mmetsp:Transcript_21935/g.50623  ORF Transcript_21935/g.50623 Transcript_21935/m.50623 type:complete len:243 (+) Transcript_21935:405-1133(+)
MRMPEQQNKGTSEQRNNRNELKVRQGTDTTQAAICHVFALLIGRYRWQCKRNDTSCIAFGSEEIAPLHRHDDDASFVCVHRLLCMIYSIHCMPFCSFHVPFDAMVRSVMRDIVTARRCGHCVFRVLHLRYCGDGFCRFECTYCFPNATEGFVQFQGIVTKNCIDGCGHGPPPASCLSLSANPCISAFAVCCFRIVAPKPGHSREQIWLRVAELLGSALKKSACSGYLCLCVVLDNRQSTINR